MYLIGALFWCNRPFLGKMIAKQDFAEPGKAHTFDVS